MNRLVEVTTTAIAGAIGSVLAVVTLGASLVTVVPVAIGVGAIFLVASYEPRRADVDAREQREQNDREPQHA